MTKIFIEIQPTTVKAIIVASDVIGLKITYAIANQNIWYSITSYMTLTIGAAISVDTSSTTVSAIKITVFIICFIIAVAISN